MGKIFKNTLLATKNLIESLNAEKESSINPFLIHQILKLPKKSLIQIQKIKKK